MGLFSSSTKNKQAAPDDGGYVARSDDEAAGARARSKRASHAGEGAPRRGREGRAAPADPILPEKKRARRRLVGAVALALGVAIGLPMVLDSEPKPLAADIAIQIPSKDRLAFSPALSAAAVNSPALKAAASETPEQISQMQLKATADTLSALPAQQEASPEPAAKPEPKPAQAKLDEPKAKAEAELQSKNVAKAPAKAEEKTAPVKPAKPESAKAQSAGLSDEARALAILEGKSEPGAAPQAPAARFMVHVIALATPDKVSEMQGRLKEAGFAPSSQKVPTTTGELTRIRVGPFSRDEAEKAIAKLHKMGLKPTLVQG
jgi:DedD protein